ncbi:type IV pilus modification PilV family protein [Haloferula sp.]|uniref:type IV pilus modification PilV family protein n=1 Tax=Haloferula sp. TaxID=2497595 RepID=UPI00329EF4DD
MRAEVRQTGGDGFTLAVVLVVMAAILLMAVGVMAVIGIERKTARSYVDAKRAEWVARAGMEDVRGILREQSANDEFLIVSQQGVTLREGVEPLDLLYLARGKGGGDNVSYQLYPLYSADEDSVTLSGFGDEFDQLELFTGELAKFKVRERNEEAWVSWIPVIDDDEKQVGRYAFWVEDLQGKLSGQTAPREPDEAEERVEWPFPAPGVREDPDIWSPELALHALDPAVTGDEDTSDLDERLVDGRGLMISPDSVLAAMEFEPPLERDELSGRLVDEEARSFEENVAAGVRAYEELPTVPFVNGISAETAGEPKLNLNKLLNAERESSIDQWADWVNEALPNFVERQGGFPDDYLRTLAANVFDYADVDSEASVMAGAYRGLDSYPLVSEYAVRFRWEKFEKINDQNHFVLSAAVYVELWNMSDQEASGSVQVSYDTAYNLELGVIPEIDLGAAELLEDPEIMTPPLPNEDGDHWLPELVLDPPLAPNEFRVVNVGQVTYRIPVDFYVLSPIELYGPNGSTAQAGFKMRWNGQVVDQARGEMLHRNMNIFYPSTSRPETRDRSRQRIAANIPGHSYAQSSFDYVNNMGDPRSAFYIDVPMSPNKYGNFSPHRRTMRWSTIYRYDSSTKPKVWGRVLPSEWPDGGHNSSYGRLPSATRSNGGEGDQRINPDDDQWLVGLPDPVREEAPMRISNLGVFYSACEMGRSYDPLMWLPTYDNSSDSAKIRDGLMPASRRSWPSVEQASPESQSHGGGNTLRVGRAEHPKFEVPEEGELGQVAGQHAAHLLDLFHVGKPKSGQKEEREGDLIWIEDRVNLNTATETAIRAMVVGNLEQDPMLSRQLTTSHSTTELMAPPTSTIELGSPAISRAGDIISRAILEHRPFASAADLAAIEDPEGEKIFGNREMYSLGDKIEWSDSAAEELYARVYESSTLRSRNFRVWVVGQAIAPLDKDSTNEPVVLAESRKVFSVFAAPGNRDSDGTIKEEDYEPEVTHENDF